MHGGEFPGRLLEGLGCLCGLGFAGVYGAQGLGFIYVPLSPVVTN